MRIPEHWAEARLVGIVDGRSRVVRRFGWSETSAADAAARAGERAAAALAELQAGRTVPTRERKQPYGGAGLPIREQIVARNGDVIVTRNSYGARCLDEPDVLFADVDFEPALAPFWRRSFDVGGWLLAIGAFALALAAFWHGRQWLGCVATTGVLALPVLLVLLRYSLEQRPPARARARARMHARVHAAIVRRKGSRFAIYETPAGLRVLALHARFDPRSEATQALLRELGTDRAYAQLCALQGCFRARVSGKPWRMDVPPIRPRPGIWPVQPERLPEREQWIEQYEAAAVRFAACRHREDLGDGALDPHCLEVQHIHDELARARTDLPLA